MRLSARILTGLLLAATAATPARADAEPMCQTVVISGTITGNRTIGPLCATSLPAHCEEFNGGATPQANYFIKVCVPI